MKKLISIFMVMALASSAFAVDVAPRISDREIIESLAELKAGQKTLENKMDQRFADIQERMDHRFVAIQEQMDLRFVAVDQRFIAMQEQMDQRFAAVDQRFDAMRAQIDQRFIAVDQRFIAVDQRFIAVDQRFEAIDQRLDFIQQLMLVTIAGIFGLIGFIVWDRYSTLRPMDTRLRRLEENLERDLELQSPEGSKLTRMIHVLRELAKEDKKIASVLRSFSLL